MARAEPGYPTRQCDRCAPRAFASKGRRWRNHEADPNCARRGFRFTRGDGRVKSWWLRRSVRLRLALWYAAATALVLIAFAWFVYEVIEHRLAAEVDRQLRIDFDLVGEQGVASPPLARSGSEQQRRAPATANLHAALCDHRA